MKKIFFIAVTICIVELSIGSVAVGQDDPIKLSRSLRSLGRLYMAYGEYYKAQPFLEQALDKVRKAGDEGHELSLCLIDMAYLKKSLGQLQEAEELCISGLELQQKFLNENHPYVAETLRTLSSIYLEEGKINQSNQALEKAKAIMQKCNIDNEFVMVPLQVDTAKLLVAKGNLEEAEQCYTNALSISNRVLGADHLYTAGLMENIAELYFLRGKYSEAEPLVNQAIAVKEKTYGAKHQLIVPALFTKAKIEMAKGNRTESEECLNRAVETVKETANITKIAQCYQNVAEIRKTGGLAYRQVAKTSETRNY